MTSLDDMASDWGSYQGLKTVSVSDQFKHASIQRQREMLPIYRHRDSITYLIESTQVVILIGHTGSGKSTQLTQYLHEDGWTKDGKIIGCTQPRRVAATSVAQRVAEEIGCRIGETVGYSIRFEDTTTEKTVIKYLTDGMLLRELMIDPLLRRYSVIMIDEAHERTIYTDILLCVLKKVIKKRKDLRLVISSATIQAHEFAKFFGDKSQIISIEGKMFPIDVLYLSEPAENYIEKTIQTIFDIHIEEPDGDILAFMTGREEITKVLQAVKDRSFHDESSVRLLPLPLYSGLSQDEQNAIFDPTPPNTRKVIIATNIAEASVTVDGVIYVIDCGYVKVRTFDPATKIDSLIVTPISKASAVQRAGRAGRTRPGKCFRIYTETCANELDEVSSPEIQRSNLAMPILQIKSLGIDNIAKLDFVTPPPVNLVINALELLYSLKALDDYAKLTIPDGLRMAELPLNPMLSKVLLASASYGCTEEILTIAAMLTVENVFYKPRDEVKAADAEHRKFTVEEGDGLSLYNVYQEFVRSKKSSKWAYDRYLNNKSLVKAVSVRNQLVRYLQKLEVNVIKSSVPATADIVRKCLTLGYFSQAARMQPDGSYKLVAAQDVTVWPHPSSVMFNRIADWVIFTEIVEVNDKIYILGITTIERDWLLELAPDYYKVKRR
ncbi:P-loop containing nucleoside triphosphate hydrolase protein [Lipomyces japonicus]|uniref:P-loop containing nucleoside triphosphate hydrolase protein n=1 Tax=Lipomyces japonicus TaxID=56871 RepID=UPI0034CEFB13